MNPTHKALLDGVYKQMEQIYQRAPGLFPADGEEWLRREAELVENLGKASGALAARALCRRFVTEFKAACAKHRKREPKRNRAGDPAGTIYSFSGEKVGELPERAAVEVADRPADRRR